ncbi:hypothetical protein A3F06_01260 [candidate division TM6 bacterium RIFCSPHIGHO2_12_FULL_36_22]|nr:MAG: hypothetical protein A3F06_01260 [candidate division TM6 bacterium RIFCSPHIGHO2_12_FULL_36_22]
MKKISLLICLCLISSIYSSSEKYLQPFAPYYSQCGQDKYVNENIFNDKKNGVFIEIGAHDGISYSNSYYFEKFLGWTGICIEPHPERFADLKLNRNCVCVEACVSNVNGEDDFLMIVGAPEQLSGLSNKYDPRHSARIDRELALDGGSKQTIKVNCVTFNDLMEEYNISFIDFLSIDTEGNEFDIIRSIDFDKYYIDIIVVERNFGDQGMNKFLRKKNFVLIKTIGADFIYRNKNSMKE